MTTKQKLQTPSQQKLTQLAQFLMQCPPHIGLSSKDPAIKAAWEYLLKKSQQGKPTDVKAMPAKHRQALLRHKDIVLEEGARQNKLMQSQAPVFNMVMLEKFKEARDEAIRSFYYCIDPSTDRPDEPLTDESRFGHASKFADHVCTAEKAIELLRAAGRGEDPENG